MSHEQLKKLIGLASLLLVLSLLYLDLEQTSPGPVTPVHAGVAELQGKDGCKGCHGSWGQAMHDACATCHEGTAASIAEARGFHGTLLGVAANDCAHCHVEHHGKELALVTAESFARAGVPDAEHYDHRALGFELGGRHTELTCSECHENAEAQVLAAGEARFAGLDQACSACHDDPHKGRMARACADCHGQSLPFADLAAFDHGPDFPLVGGHRGLACAGCHEPESAHSVEALGSHDPPAARDCSACHESPHAQRFLARTAADLGVAPERTCAECHAASDLAFATPATRPDASWHGATGFALTKPHTDVACDQCHAPAPRDGNQDGSDFATRFPGRRANECASCHEDPHGGQFAASPFVLAALSEALGAGASACLACHARTAFAPPVFGLETHARTSFPLEGGHEAVGCTECHTQDAAGMRVFTGTARACDACHADPHPSPSPPNSAESFTAFRGPTTFAEREGCARCHTTETFSSVQDFDHPLWTGFALTGAHERAECESCHARAHGPDAFGRTFGRIEEVFGQPTTACATCHTDAHRGAFDHVAEAPSEQPEKRPAPSAEGCALCHSSETFADVPDFDHARWTSFALAGAHARSSCESCHPRADVPDAHGRTLGFAPTEGVRDCRGCHEDVHAGRFDAPGLPELVEGREGCARCHTTESFRELGAEWFDHGLWTGYRLLGAHALVSCESCHGRAPARELPSPGRTADGSPAAQLARTLGHARGTDCADCHVDPHVGQFAAEGRNDCARCHTVGRDFSIPSFDHAAQSRFALDPTHAKLECSACHRPSALADGSSAVRYRPLGVDCGDCHGRARGPR